MTEKSPRVSIGLPVYNGEDYLKDSIESILAQTFTDLNLIISDNASTDRTQEICESYVVEDERVMYYRNDRNLGAAYNYNRVFNLSHSEYFKWGAHDDLCAPTFVERCVEVLDREPNVVVSYPHSVLIDGNGMVIEHYADGLHLRSPQAYKRFGMFLKTPGWCHPIFGVIRSEVLKSTPLIGNYPRSDRNLIGELAIRGEIYEIPESLFFRRIHPKISIEVHDTEKSLAVWFDPNNQGKLIFPRGRRFIEYIKSISRVHMPLSQRMRCYLTVFRYLVYPRRWQGVGEDIANAIRGEHAPQR